MTQEVIGSSDILHEEVQRSRKAQSTKRKADSLENLPARAQLAKNVNVLQLYDAVVARISILEIARLQRRELPAQTLP